MFGLGKNRSKLGKWLDNRGISQQWLVKKSGLGRNTISDLTTGDNEREPNAKTMKKILSALRELDPKVKSDDFWKM
ncbi:XRE family transcriptional regulator [Fictibacillus phosphorivorans]|uniref:XRE family transcriptional regulator n=1 Tax=Fictibacillus phosphorivorans TaxID=1221500 RepID=A0A163QSS8_9BACL|nr:helix-turn-helix transcriptional regulator [Fictibacillus phosphorivorans]KZE65616.1 XRE family transcriptional regulator [Fictibacillus phosphorivorans]